MKISILLPITLLFTFFFSSCVQKTTTENSTVVEAATQAGEPSKSTDCHPSGNNSVKATATSLPNFSRTEAIREAQKLARMDAQNSCSGNCEGTACNFFEQGIETSTTHSINPDKTYSYLATTTVTGKCLCE